MTADEAVRHEWFAAPSPLTPMTSSQILSPSAVPQFASAASGGPSAATEVSFDSEAASLTVSAGSSGVAQQQNGDRSSMYTVFKAKKTSSTKLSASLSREIQQLNVSETSQRSCELSPARKRIDGNSNLDDSGTFLPSIL